MRLPKKAIITMAGSGTRFLPATKAIPKEMLPLIDKPIAQYSVEELVLSGIDDLILVVRQGESAGTIRRHFLPDKELENYLSRTGKKDRLKEIKNISKMAKFSFIEQTKNMPYGNAMPLRAAAELVGNAPFFYLFGDDLTLAETPVPKQLLNVFKKESKVAAVIAVKHMPEKELTKYAVVKIKKGTHNVVERIVEKPEIKDAPSDLAVFGRYLFTPKILSIVKKLKKGKNNELWLTDAIAELVKKEKVVICPINGQWLTTGDPLNYLKAMIEFTWQRNDLKNQFRQYIVDKLNK